MLLRYVSTSLKALMKGVQTNGQAVEDDLDDLVRQIHF